MSWIIVSFNLMFLYFIGNYFIYYIGGFLWIGKDVECESLYI